MTVVEDLTALAVQLRLGKRWSMLPSTGQNKGPCVLWKDFQNQLPTPDQVRQWGLEFNPERWGVVTGALAGIVVVDFDGDQGRELMRKWKVDPHVRTGSGGFHWYLKHPGCRVPTLNAKTGKGSWPWPGVDIRGDGGFAVLLGHNSNGPYEQLRELIPDPFDRLPLEVRTFLQNPGKGKSSQARLIPIRPLKSIAAGRVQPDRLINKALVLAGSDGRNNAGFWLACQFRDNRFSPEEAETGMRDYRSRTASTNTKGKIEPYAESEMLASLRQAYSQPARNRWERKTDPHSNFTPGAGSLVETGRNNLGDSSSRKETPTAFIADDPEYLDIHVSHPCESLVDHPCDALSKSRFARIAENVFADNALKDRDVRVYLVLAYSCWPSNVSTVGIRRIAKRACCSDRLVTGSLRRLERAGHIRARKVKRGSRGEYELLSQVFEEQKLPSAGVAPISSPQTSRITPRKGSQAEVVSMPRTSLSQRKSL